MDYLRRKDDGRYIVRVVVPQRLHAIVGQKQFERSVGRDPRVAQRRAYALIAEFQKQIARAERQLELQGLADLIRPKRRFSPAEIAHAHYGEELAADDEMRNLPELHVDMTWSRPVRLAKLRQLVAGAIEPQEAAALIGWAVTKFAERDGSAMKVGSPDWYAAARTLASVQIEIMDRQAERDQGRFDGTPSLPILVTVPEPLAPDPVKLATLFNGYFRELLAQNRGAVAQRRWNPVFVDLRAFLKHDDALQITKQNLQHWKDDLIGRLAAKTIRDVYFSAVKAIFAWAADTGRIPSNPASGLKVKVAKAILSREKGFNDDEAVAVLKAADAYHPKASDNPATLEQPPLVAAKRWTPWLCAYTGARISEMTQLRKEDARVKDGIHYLRITSDAGSVKAGIYRDVPIHPHLIERGFLDFVKAADDGPLFYRTNKDRTSATPYKTVSGRVGDWVRGLDIVADSVQPNHGWRHRFKTVTIELGLSQRACDAIQGHAARTAGENYGDVTLKAKKTAIDSIPSYII